MDARHIRGLSWACCAGLAAFALACSGSETSLDDRPDVVLVVVDTLRADHASLYGYAFDTTPEIARIAERGVTFDVAYAPTGTTGVSHATLFTSRHPLVHGVVRNGLPLVEEEMTLAERLRGAGYRTAAFVSSFPVSGRFGFDQGFDHYDDDFDLATSSSPHREWIGVEVPEGFDRPPNATTEAAIQWLDRSNDEDTPLFLWVHYYDPHSPNRPPAAWKDRFGRTRKGRRGAVIDAYDAELAYTDSEVGRLLAHLGGRDPRRETLVVFTSDHGEGLWTHGERYHDRFTYEEEVRVPLVLSWPGRLPEGVRIAQPAHLIDVLPTLASLLGLDWSGDGLDLTPFIDGRLPPDPERPIYLQRPFFNEGRPQYGEKGHGFGVRVGRFKYYEALEEERRELYDLTLDPEEQRNLAGRRPALVARFSGMIAQWRREQLERAPRRDLRVPEDAKAALRALGYIDEDSAMD